MKSSEREERDSNILRMHFQGASALKIANHFGMNRRSVYRILKRHDVWCGYDVSQRAARGFPDTHINFAPCRITVSDAASTYEGDPLLDALVKAYPGGPPVRDVAVASRLF